MLEVDLGWFNGVLYVDSAWEAEPNIIDTISGLVLYLMRWVAFSETRWAKVGMSSRLWLRSLAGGLYPLWRLVMEDAPISKYHIGGYKAEHSVRLLLATAAFSPLSAESTLMALFEDDRFLRRTQELWDLAVSEITYLNNLPDSVYKRVVDLAELEMGCYAFRSHALHCAHITLSYLWFEMFEQTEKLPLSLTQRGHGPEA